MEIGEYEVRTMKQEEIPQAIEIWTETGLAEGTHTLYSWYGVDPEGFYIAVNKEGEIYGTCAAIVLNDDLAFLGLYAVRSKYQKMGIGVKIWKAAMQHVGNRNAGLNSVPQHLHTYRDLAGFRLVAQWETVLYESKNINMGSILSSLPNITISKVDCDTLPELIDFDESVHGYNRSKIISLTTKEQNSISLVAHAKDSDGSVTVCGYGSIKKNIQGTAMIGPLYANDLNTAEVLLSNLISFYPYSQEFGLIIMIIDCNVDAIVLVEKLGMELKTKLPRCYLKNKVDVVFHKVFGVHALNFSAF